MRLIWQGIESDLMMPDNDYYGHRTAMARYCGLKQLSPAVFGSIRHGWQPDLGSIGDRTLKAAPIFVWNEREQRQAAERAIPNVVAIGAPFLYGVASLQPGTTDPRAGLGTIVFPLHSDGFTEALQDRQRFIDEVEHHEQGPFTVSIYYQDLDRPGAVEPYRRAGWRVVSFGTRDDPQFMPRLILELQSHAAVVSDVLCSAIWYGAHLGRRVRILGAPPSLSDRALPDGLAQRWPEVHGDGVSGARARDLAAIELGVDHLRSPDELAQVLGWRSWHRYAAPLVRLAVDARHGSELRRGQPLSRTMRRTGGA